MTPPTMSVLPALHPSATQLPSGPATGLRCRECGATYPLAPEHVCVECFGPLEVDYDLDALRRVTRKSVAAGPPSMCDAEVGRRRSAVDVALRGPPAGRPR